MVNLKITSKSLYQQLIVELHLCFFFKMILVSQGSVGSFCVALSVLRVSWYALFTLMWRIQGVTPATLTSVGLLRTVYGPFQCRAKESCFQSLTTPDPQAQIHESVSQGGTAPFLAQT